MKKVVQKLMLWSAAMAVVLSASGSAKAATLKDIVDSLTASGYAVNLQSPALTKVAFVKTGDIGINVIEATDNISFGFTRGSGANKTNDVILSAKRIAVGPASGQIGFDVYSSAMTNSSTLGTIKQGDTVALKDSTKVGNTILDTGLTSSKKLDANVIGNGPFHFSIVTHPNFSGPNSAAEPTRVLTNLGNTTRSMSENLSGNAKFFEYTINGTGIYANSYLIAYTDKNSQGVETYTFAAIVSGVVNPEPASIAMLGTGVLGLAGLWRRRRNAANAVVAAV